MPRALKVGKVRHWTIEMEKKRQFRKRIDRCCCGLR